MVPHVIIVGHCSEVFGAAINNNKTLQNRLPIQSQLAIKAQQRFFFLHWLCLQMQFNAVVGLCSDQIVIRGIEAHHTFTRTGVLRNALALSIFPLPSKLSSYLLTKIIILVVRKDFVWGQGCSDRKVNRTHDEISAIIRIHGCHVKFESLAKVFGYRGLLLRDSIDSIFIHV